MRDTTAITQQLLPDIRLYLAITWEDPEGDKNLSGIISRGIAYLDNLAQRELDYLQEDTPRALLMDYCRYVRSAALDDFWRNYRSELVALQMREARRRVESDNVPNV